MQNSPDEPQQDVFTAKWLEHVVPEALDKLRSVCVTVDFPDRGIIYRLGGAQPWLWGVKRGKVRVHVCLNEMDPVLGHIHLTGAWFGESELLLQLPGLVEMQAAGETSLTRIDFAAFRSLANNHPALWEALARLTSLNQVLAMTAANDLALRTGRKRLAAVLLRLSGHRAGLQTLTPSPAVPASQTEVANLANVSLSTASDLLREFATAKMIRLDYKRIVVLEPDWLQSVIEERS